MKVVLTLEYDGSLFAGWQEQPKILTVQGAVQDALLVYVRSARKKLKGLSVADGSTSEPQTSRIVVVGSGRTDAGVHADGQVASLRWPDDLPFEPERVRKSLNGILPPGVAIREIRTAADGFDARFAPHVKQYRYRLLLTGSTQGAYRAHGWYIHGSLDIAAMCQAARLFTGIHDFTEFRAKDCPALTSERTILRSELTRSSEATLDYYIQGKGFLKQMVRILVGTLVGVGQGRVTCHDVERMLRREMRRPSELRIAPAAGLFLEWVRYLEQEYYNAEITAERAGATPDMAHDTESW